VYVSNAAQTPARADQRRLLLASGGQLANATGGVGRGGRGEGGVTVGAGQGQVAAEG